MSTSPASRSDVERDDAPPPEAERRVEDRAEEIVERLSAQVAHFARRLVARTREEVEDIVADAQSLRRGNRPRE